MVGCDPDGAARAESVEFSTPAVRATQVPLGEVGDLSLGLGLVADASLLTTDIPIVLMRGFGEDPRAAVGSMTAAGVLTALDRRVALVITGPGEEDLQLPGDVDLARALNQNLLSGARRVVFHHPDDDPLQGLQMPEPREREVKVGPLPETD